MSLFGMRAAQMVEPSRALRGRADAMPVPERHTVRRGGLRCSDHGDRPAGEFYFAEGYHQQYLDKNPFGYCPDHGTGVSCPVGVARADG